MLTYHAPPGQVLWPLDLDQDDNLRIQFAVWYRPLRGQPRTPRQISRYCM